MNIKCKRLQTYAAGIFVMAAVLSGCGGQTDSEHVSAEPMAYEAGTLVMGTGEEGVQIHQAGRAIAEVINNTVPGIHVAVETTKGTMINSVNVSEGDLDLALVTGDVAYDAVYGEYAFEGCSGFSGSM